MVVSPTLSSASGISIYNTVQKKRIFSLSHMKMAQQNEEKSLWGAHSSGQNNICIMLEASRSSRSVGSVMGASLVTGFLSRHGNRSPVGRKIVEIDVKPLCFFLWSEQENSRCLVVLVTIKVWYGRSRSGMEGTFRKQDPLSIPVFGSSLCPLILPIFASQKGFFIKRQLESSSDHSSVK